VTRYAFIGTNLCFPFDERIALLASIEGHAEADRRTLADLPLEKAVQMSGTASDHLRAEERFASALQEASKADIRSRNGQCVGGAEIWPQPMSMLDIDLQPYVFWRTARTSGGNAPGELIEQSRLPVQIGCALRPGLQVYPDSSRRVLCELPVRGLVRRRGFGIRGSWLKASIQNAAQVVGGVGTDRAVLYGKTHLDVLSACRTSGVPWFPENGVMGNFVDRFELADDVTSREQ
jgi:hypothetical protein